MKTFPDHLQLPALTQARGVVALPGSKSISNRVLLLAALAEGDTDVLGLLDSDDTRVMLDALSKLGVSVTPIGEHAVRVKGTGGDFPVKQASLFLGNAGTAFRPLTAVLAFQRGDYILDGVPRMRERPIGDLIDALEEIQCLIEYLRVDGFPPIRVWPDAIIPTKHMSIKGSTSSQFLSALLIAAPLWAKREGRVHIHVDGELISKPYVEITLNLLRRFGVNVEQEGWQRFTFEKKSFPHSPSRIHVEGDASSASYFLAAGALGGGPVRVTGVGRASIQGDVKFADALALMGAHVDAGEDWIESRAPEQGRLQGIDIDCNPIPDAAMTLAVLALFAEGVTTLKNIASWRVKETDRLTAMATELRKFGAAVEEGADHLRILPPASLRTPASGIDTYDDHRIAMCFSLCALGGIPVTINDPKCVAKTFPDYFDVFSGISK